MAVAAEKKADTEMRDLDVDGLFHRGFAAKGVVRTQASQRPEGGTENAQEWRVVGDKCPKSGERGERHNDSGRCLVAVETGTCTHRDAWA